MRIGSRGSALALWQSEHIRERLQQLGALSAIELEIIQTTGDKIQDVPLAKIGDKGLFTKELDRALLDRRVDLVVHSLKDVPTRLEPGLALAAVTEREPAADALIVADGMPRSLDELPAGARIGTSSLRRRAQLLARRRDIEVLDLRGNVDTRLAQVMAGKYDAIILALAGLKRLGLTEHVAETLSGSGWLPAVGQGALAIVCREDDETTRRALASLDHRATRLATTAERAFLRELEGGCQVPIAALAEVSGEQIELQGLVASLDGQQVLRGQGTGSDAEATGRALGHDLLERGAGAILAAVRAVAFDTPQPSAP